MDIANPTAAQPGTADFSAPSTIAGLLKAGQLSSNGGPALKLGNDSISHAELHDLLLQAESDLRRLGIGRHTRVVTALPDGALAACGLLALTRSAICAPVNPDLRGAELEILIPELDVQAVVAHGACADEARRTATALGLPVIEVDWKDARTLQWSGPALPEPPSMAEACPDDTALILLTSGSSARPKRVPLTHRHLTLSAQRMARSIALTSGDVCLNLMPMFHVGAVVDLLLAPLSVGGSVIRPSVMSVPAFFEALEQGKSTWFQGVPTLLHELAVHGLRRHGAQPTSSLRLVRSVSSPLPPDWIAEIESALGAPVIEIYGMTETAGVITSNPLPPAPRKVGSVGLPTTLEIMIKTADGHAASADVRGEILVRGPGVMTGYEKLEGGNRGLTDDGWLKTGDEGYFDADGYLFITGRIGDQINRGGEKVSPREIDEVLVSHPAVQDAAAFPMPHPQLGQDVAAAIVLKPGMEVTAEELTAYVSDRLAYFKVPKAIHVVAELPRGPGGKLRRRLLPDMVRSIPALTSTASDAAEAPQTEMEKRVAAWWATELRVTVASRDADFFDLGGDSLAAASFTVAVEKELGIQVRPAALFDHPTVAAYAGYLEQAMTAHTGLTQVSGEAKMNEDYRRLVLAAVSVWPGVRHAADSLLVGRRTDAPGLPVFWCGQGRGEFDPFVKHLPEQHPVYGTRSLYLFEGKKKHDEEALAVLLAQEIEQLRTGREIIIGGFCAGGRIMYEAACHLRARGVPIRMVFMHEAWSTRGIDVPVAMGFTRDYEFSPYRRFNRPEALMAKRFTAGWKVWFLDTAHNGIYADEPLTQEMQKLRALWENPAGFDRSPPMQEVPGIHYRARLECRLYTRWTVAGWMGVAWITVTNISRHTWLPATQSGLHLGHRWLDGQGQPVGDPGRSLPLRKALPRGKSIRFTLPFKAPSQAGKHTLEIDMVDEGLAWFSEKKATRPSHSLRLNIQTFNLVGQRPTVFPTA